VRGRPGDAGPIIFPAPIPLGLLLLQVVQEDVEGLGVLAEVRDHCAGGVHGLLDGAVHVELGQAAHLAQLRARVHHDQVHAALLAERAHQPRVLVRVAVLGQAAQPGRVPVQGLGALVKSTAKTIVDESLL